MSRLAGPLALALAPFLVALDAAAEPARGIDYREVAAARPVQRERIEVIEFFWYRCPHCYEFEFHLKRWAARLPADVVVRRVPAVFSKEWEIDARIFYALEAMREEGRLRAALFDAIHRGGARRLTGTRYLQWVEEWLSSQGIDVAQFRTARHSKAVEDQIEQSRRMTIGYKLEGTPTLGVNRRCIVDANSGDHARMLAITSYLVHHARQMARCSR